MILVTGAAGKTGRAAISSTELQRKVKAVEIDKPTWAKGARNAGLGGYRLDSLLEMFNYYDRHGLIGNTGALRGLLNRPPTDFAGFVRRTERAGV